MYSHVTLLSQAVLALDHTSSSQLKFIGGEDVAMKPGKKLALRRSALVVNALVYGGFDVSGYESP